MAVLQAELAVQLCPALPLWRQVGEQAQARQPLARPVEHFGVLEVETLAGEGVEGLEQAFLQREGQGDRQPKLSAVQALQLGRGENFAHQALGAFVIEQGFLIQAQALAAVGASDHSGGPALAMGDRAMNAGGPDGRAVFMGARHVVATVQALQRGPCACTAGQVLGLALGHRAQQAGAWHYPRALEVVGP